MFCLSDQLMMEPVYRYSKIELSPSAKKIAVNEHNDILIAENTYGKGSVIVTTPHYMQAYDGDELLESGQRRFTVFLEIAKDLITHRVDEFSPIKVQGPPVEYIITRISVYPRGVSRLFLFAGNHDANIHISRSLIHYDRKIS